MMISTPYEPDRPGARPVRRQINRSLLSIVECVSLAGGSAAAEGDLHTVWTAEDDGLSSPLYA